MESRLGPSVGRTTLRNSGGITSKGQEDRCIWDIVPMRFYRETGEVRQESRTEDW